jgi:hypothetical protein
MPRKRPQVLGLDLNRSERAGTRSGCARGRRHAYRHACSARVVAGESRLRGQLAAMAPVGEAARGKDIGNVKNKGLPQFCRTFRGEPFAAQGSYKRTFSPPIYHPEDVLLFEEAVRFCS